MVKLSDKEWLVLGVLWNSGGAALGVVTQALREETGWNRNTVHPEHNVRFIAVNDGVDSDQGDDDFSPFRNIMKNMCITDSPSILTGISFLP